MAGYSYGDASMREDLGDDIKDLDVLETYVSSNSETVPVTNKVHSWVVDPITATSTQAGTIEMADTTYAMANPTLLTNTTQIIEKGIRVGGTQMNTDHAGFDNKFAREKLKKMKEWKNQLEFSVVAGSLVSGTGTAARTMDGIPKFATTLTSTLASGVSLTSAMLNAWLMNAREAGESHDTVLVGAMLKTRISMFTENNTRNIDAKSAELVGRVDVYDSDGGRVKVIYHRFVDSISEAVTHALVSYISDYVRVGVMDEVHYEDRAIAGYFKAGAVVGEYTAEVGNEKAVAVYKIVK